MPYNIIFHPGVHTDVDKALKHYEAVSTALGLNFESELINCYSRIAQNPNYYFVLHKKLNVRRILLKKFPYKLIFSIRENKTVWVVALAHHRQGALWKKRLK